MIQITGTLLFDQIPKSTAQMKRVNHRTGQFFYSKAQEQTIRQYERQLIQFKPNQPITGLSTSPLSSPTVRRTRRNRGSARQVAQTAIT